MAKKFIKAFSTGVANVYLFALKLFHKAGSDLKNSLIILKNKLAEESSETKEMLDIYARYSQGKATSEEMKKANEQFRDLIRALGLSAFLILPFAPVTIPILVKIGKKLGIEILPSSFRSTKK